MEFILYLLAIAIMLWAQFGVQKAYRKYRSIPAMCSYTGAEAARIILDDNGCNDISVELSHSGTLSDHFDPQSKIIRLSKENYYGKSIAAIAIAAHESGHAIQHATGYRAIDFRNNILPYASVASQLGWVSIFIGLFVRLEVFIAIGIIMLGIIALFQVVTLPIEFDASKRALTILSTNGMLEYDEVDDAQKMLKAAAFTYVAALISTIFNILRILLISSRNND